MELLKELLNINLNEALNVSNSWKLLKDYHIPTLLSAGREVNVTTMQDYMRGSKDVSPEDIQKIFTWAENKGKLKPGKLTPATNPDPIDKLGLAFIVMNRRSEPGMDLATSISGLSPGEITDLVINRKDELESIMRSKTGKNWKYNDYMLKIRGSNKLQKVGGEATPEQLDALEDAILKLTAHGRQITGLELEKYKNGYLGLEASTINGFLSHTPRFMKYERFRPKGRGGSKYIGTQRQKRIASLAKRT